MYAIVKFLDESDAPGIVCTHWVNNEENSCRYPNVRTNEARDRLLRKLAMPGHDWISCPIKVLHKYSSFTEALLYLPKAEETSNLDSEDEILNMPRRKFTRRIPHPDEESDEDCGPAQKRPACNVEPYPVPPSNAEICSKNVSKHKSATSHLEKPACSSDNAKSSTSHLQKPTCSSSPNVINGKLIAWMADISEKVLQLEEKIDLVLQNQAQRLDRNQVPEGLQDRNEDFTILGGLPAVDYNGFIEINKKIAEDSVLRHSLVKVLISVGGKDMRCHIHNMLRRLLTDDVAEMYSISGKSTLKNTTKKSFLATEVSRSIFSACQRVFKDMATEVKIKEAVGDWLNQAKVRKNRRMERQEKNKENNLE